MVSHELVHHRVHQSGFGAPTVSAKEKTIHDAIMTSRAWQSHSSPGLGMGYVIIGGRDVDTGMAAKGGPG